MKRKYIYGAVAICFIGIIGFSVSASTNNLELNDLPKNQRNEIIQQKLENQNSSNELPEIDYSSKEAIFESFGFTEEDRRDTMLMPLELNSNSINKEYIYDKMLNTIDYYTSVQGSFSLKKFYSNVEYTVSYCINGGEEHQSFEKFINTGDFPAGYSFENDNEGPPREIVAYFDGETRIEAAVAEREYNRSSDTQGKNIIDSYHIDVDEKEDCDFASLIKATSRITTDDEGINTYYYRENLNGLGYSRESVDPQELAMGYLGNFNTWSIANQEVILGRECSVIKGSLSGHYSEKLHTTDFTLWVDNETGILIQLEGYDAEGNLAEQLISHDIIVNMPTTASAVQAMFDEG